MKLRDMITDLISLFIKFSSSNKIFVYESMKFVAYKNVTNW